MSVTEQPPKVIFFDVFGTVVNWRPSVTKSFQEAAARALNDSSRHLGPEERNAAASMTAADWLSLAEEWRKSYLDFTHTFDASRPSTFVTVDQHHHDSLKTLLRQRNLEALFTPQEIKQLSLCWHSLEPWPDSAPSLRCLNRKFQTCTLSNGNLSLLEDLQRFGSLPFTRVVSAEQFKAYKPSPAVYQGAAASFGLSTGDCALVAAHLADLKAAKSQGFQTIYVEREKEEWSSAAQIAEMRQAGVVDMWISKDQDGFLEVARRFGLESE